MIKRARLYLKSNLTWYHLIASLLYGFIFILTNTLIIGMDRSINSQSLYLVFLFVTIFNLLFALLKKPRPLLQILATLVGSFITAYTIIGELFKPIWHFIQLGSIHLYQLLSYTIQSIRNENILLTSPDSGLVQQQWQTLVQAVSALSGRLRLWLFALPEPAYDPVVLNLLWSMAIWLSAAWFFWYVVKRKRSFPGILPPLLIGAGIYQSNESRLGIVFIITGICILLTMLAHHAKQEDKWNKIGLTTSRTLRKGVAQYGVWISIGLVIVAGIISSPRIDEWIEDWRDRRQSSSETASAATGNYLEGDDAPGAADGPEEVLLEASIGALPNIHLLGSPPELAETEVFWAQIEEVSSEYASAYYFRSATYEDYGRTGWRTTDKDYVYVPPEEEFEIEYTINEKLIYQQVTFVEYSTRGNIMMTVGELSAADVPHYTSYHTSFTNNTYTDQFASVTRANQYGAYSISPYYTEDDLRYATLNYPTWIANKYLQVPDAVPDRVYDLALSLTATQPSQYDRAIAIETYLRNFEYTLDLPDPPLNEDIVDYFLFDLQKGYCDYYASAMVVLARAAGIPARLVTGYVANKYVPEQDAFIVTADQAHAWVEIYFPEYGWVTFEPTAGRPALERQETRDELLPDLELAQEDDLQAALDENTLFQPLSIRPKNIFGLLFELIILGSLLLAAYHVIDRWILTIMKPRRMVAAVYHRLRRFAVRLGTQTTKTNTPLEFAAEIQATFQRLNDNRIFNRYFGSIPETAEEIISACSRAAYTNHSTSDEEMHALISKWVRLRWRLLLAWFFLRIKPLVTELESIWYRMQQPA